MKIRTNLLEFLATVLISISLLLRFEFGYAQINLVNFLGSAGILLWALSVKRNEWSDRNKLLQITKKLGLIFILTIFLSFIL